MRVVIDTNVLVSALISPGGKPGLIIGHLRDGDFTLLYSDALLGEWLDVLSRPRIQNKYHITNEDIQTILMLILLRGQAITPDRQITACRDPKDNQFLEVAAAGQADVIVSGDKDLLVLDPFENISIVSPHRFLLMLQA